METGSDRDWCGGSVLPMPVASSSPVAKELVVQLYVRLSHRNTSRASVLVAELSVKAPFLLSVIETRKRSLPNPDCCMAYPLKGAYVLEEGLRFLILWRNISCQYHWGKLER